MILEFKACLVMGRMYEIRVAAENDDGLSSNATEQLNTPIGVPEAEPLNVRYDFSDRQVLGAVQGLAIKLSHV